MNSFKLCEEPFPITMPDYEGCVNTFDNLDKFWELREGGVSNDETCGDIVNRENDDKLFVVYSKEDIISWTKKLNNLDIK